MREPAMAVAEEIRTLAIRRPNMGGCDGCRLL